MYKIYLFIIILISLSNGFCNVQDDINKFFDDMSVYSVTTDAKIINGQRQGYMTLGSLKVKTKYKKINLFTVQAPYVKAGCGGIDIFYGGFSFVNKDELKQMLQAIAQNAAGYMFQIAFESMCPTCNAIMKDLADMANEARNFLGDSCNAAKYLINKSGAKDAVQSSLSEYCIGSKSKSGSDDMVGLRGKCYSNYNGEMRNYLQGIKTSFTNAYNTLESNFSSTISVNGTQADNLSDSKNIIRPGNLIYDKLLESFPGSSNKDLRNLILSTIGFPYAIYNNDSFESIEYQPPTLSYKGFIYGKDFVEKIEIINCVDSLCYPDSTNSHMQYQDITNSYIPFKDKIENALLSIYDKISNVNTNDLTQAEKSLIASIGSVPVYTNLVDIATVKNDSFAHIYIKRVSGTVANEIAYNYFMSIRKIMNEISTKLDINEDLSLKFNAQIQNIYNEQDRIYEQEKDKLKNLSLSFEITDRIKGAIRNLMPQQIKNIK